MMLLFHNDPMAPVMHYSVGNGGNNNLIIDSSAKSPAPSIGHCSALNKDKFLPDTLTYLALQGNSGHHYYHLALPCRSGERGEVSGYK